MSEKTKKAMALEAGTLLTVALCRNNGPFELEGYARAYRDAWDKLEPGEEASIQITFKRPHSRGFIYQEIDVPGLPVPLRAKLDAFLEELEATVNKTRSDAGLDWPRGTGTPEELARLAVWQLNNNTMMALRDIT